MSRDMLTRRREWLLRQNHNIGLLYLIILNVMVLDTKCGHKYIILCCSGRYLNEYR